MASERVTLLRSPICPPATPALHIHCVPSRRPLEVEGRKSEWTLVVRFQAFPKCGNKGALLVPTVLG